MQGVIQQARASKSGKTLGVQIGGQWYSTKHFELQNMVGQEITFKTSESEFNGTVMHWLNDYTVAGASTNTADQAFDAAYAQHKGESQAMPQAPQNPQIDTQASIVAQALTKACTGAGDDPNKVWGRYQFFYNRAHRWDGTIKKTPEGDGFPDPEDFDDEIPF